VTEQELLRRLTNIEVQLARVMHTLSAFGAGLQQASTLGATCATCENDPTKMRTCAVEDCPCGIPAELPPTEEGMTAVSEEVLDVHTNGNG